MMFDVIQLRKVYQPSTSFSGCLLNVVYNGVTLPLWQSVLHKDSRAVCCRKPTTVLPRTISTLPAVTFYGFGYMTYNQQTLPQLSRSLGLKLKFRTFTPDAVVLLLTQVPNLQVASNPDIADYCGIFLNGGKLLWYIVSDDSSVSVESQQMYNTGNWYEVCGDHFLVR